MQIQVPASVRYCPTVSRLRGDRLVAAAGGGFVVGRGHSCDSTPRSGLSSATATSNSLPPAPNNFTRRRSKVLVQLAEPVWGPSLVAFSSFVFRPPLRAASSKLLTLTFDASSAHGVSSLQSLQPSPFRKQPLVRHTTSVSPVPSLGSPPLFSITICKANCASRTVTLSIPSPSTPPDTPDSTQTDHSNGADARIG